MQQKVSVFRKESFNAAHRLNNPNWSDEKNKQIFGKCNNPNYHGHNYELFIKITGLVDEETGYVIDTKVLSDIVQQNVTDVFDHRNLNLDIPAFKTLNPSAENIAIVIYDILRPLIKSDLDICITLYETPKNFVQYPA